MTKSISLDALVALGRKVKHCPVHGGEWCSSNVEQFLKMLVDDENWPTVRRLREEHVSPMNLTAERLWLARCGLHQDSEYSPTCVYCVRQYFLQLIDDNYTPKTDLETLQAAHRALKAERNSLHTQLINLQEDSVGADEQ